MATDYPDERTRGTGNRTGEDRPRLGQERNTHFPQPVPRKLALLGGLLGTLAATLPVYWLYPESTTRLLPTTDPAAATPAVALVGAFAAGVAVLSGAVLAATALIEREHAPLSASAVRALRVAETAASYLGFVTGGIAAAVALTLFALGLGGAGAVEAYVATTGHDPYATGAHGVTVLHVAAAGFWGAVGVLAVRWYLRRTTRR